MRSWLYLLHHSNLPCSYTKLLPIALQPKPNCCWNAFSRTENTEKQNTAIAYQPTLHIMLLNYIVLYFLVFNTVTHWGTDNTGDMLWPFPSEYLNNISCRLINQITLQPFIRSQGIKCFKKTLHVATQKTANAKALSLPRYFSPASQFHPVQLQL